MAIAAFAACSGPAFDPATVADATTQQVTRVEPLSWWTGMKTPLQLLVQGENISEYNVAVEGGKGVSVTRLNKADSPNFLFVDVKIAANAQPGTYYIVFSKDGESFKYPYEIAAREEGSAERKSFTTADMIYLIMPDRFANGDNQMTRQMTQQTSMLVTSSLVVMAVTFKVLSIILTISASLVLQQSGVLLFSRTTSLSTHITDMLVPITITSIHVSETTTSSRSM